MTDSIEPSKMTDATKEFVHQVELGNGIKAEEALRRIPMQEWESQLKLAKAQAESDYKLQKAPDFVPYTSINVWHGTKSPSNWEADPDVLFVEAGATPPDQISFGLLWDHVNVKTAQNLDDSWTRDFSKELAEKMKHRGSGSCDI